MIRPNADELILALLDPQQVPKYLETSKKWFSGVMTPKIPPRDMAPGPKKPEGPPDGR